jgi:hypothetical protein
MPPLIAVHGWPRAVRPHSASRLLADFGRNQTAMSSIADVGRTQFPTLASDAGRAALIHILDSLLANTRIRAALSTAS